MFRVSQHPSSGALKIVTATSGIGHNTGTATSFQRGLKKKSVNVSHSQFYVNRTINMESTGKHLFVPPTHFHCAGLQENPQRFN